MRRKQLLDFLVYLAVRMFVCILQAVPLETSHRLCRWLARLATDYIRLRRDVIEDNLCHAFPEMSERQRRRVTMQMWEHLFLMVVEIAHTPRKIHDTNWRDYFQFKNGELASNLFFDNRAGVIVSGHYGNFELGAYLFGIFHFRTWSIARNLDNPYLHRWLNAFRSSKGQYILPKEGSAETANRVLEAAGTISLLADQYAGPKGCWVDFFGRPASTHKAIALFSLAHQAPLGVMYARRLGKPLYYEMGVEAVADPRDPNCPATNVKELTQWYTSKLEEVIRRAPEQYWWVHRRWKDQHLAPQARRKAA